MWHIDNLKHELAEAGILGRLAFLVAVGFFLVHLLIFITFISLLFLSDANKSGLVGIWLIAHVLWELAGGIVYWIFRAASRTIKWVLLGE